MKRLISMILVLVILLTSLPMTASAAKGGKLIALTFDDGPSVYTPSLLDGLAKRNVKVTFFILGQCAEYYPSTVKRAYDEGHQIAQHTYNHPALTTKTNDQIRWQIQTTDAILDKILGQDLDYLIRTPYGDCNDRVLSQLGTANIIWSVDSCDWQLLNSEKVCNQIVNTAYDGAIILVHDIHKTSIPGALKAIDILMARGYEFVTVSELFRRRGVELQAGKKYYSCKPNGVDYGELTEPTLRVENNGFVFNNIPHGAKVYYTFNGSEPNSNSYAYAKPIPLQNATLRYRVIADGARTQTRTITLTKRGNLFYDIKTWDWYFNDVDRAVTLGLFQGVGEYCFEPNTGLTRAMFVTVLYRLLKQQGLDVQSGLTTQFSDLTQIWYTKPVAWASKNGIVRGYEDGTFRPDQTISREEMCVILDRTLQWLGVEMRTTIPKFTDVQNISLWARDSVARVSNAGLLCGFDDGSFGAKKTATRAQSATVILRLYDLLNKD